MSVMSSDRKDRFACERLSVFGKKMQQNSETLLGYPVNLDMNFGALEPLLKYHVNNVGDPTEDSATFGMHSHDFERDVLEWFAKLWKLDDQPWGYVTNGGTEGNIFGCYLGRELLPNAVLYSSDQAHYSIPKAARLCRIEMAEVSSLPGGEIDCSDLSRLLTENKGRPALLVLNVGTTMKGAVDDIDKVLYTLAKAGYGDGDFYIHCDAALSGMMLPFVLPDLVSFQKKIHSMSVSGHKFIGMPVPCGVVMTRLNLVNRISSEVEYLGRMHDNTLSGSRNGLAAVGLWYVIAKKGCSGLQKLVKQCYGNARLLRRMLEEAGCEDVRLSAYSTTVTFKSPRDTGLIQKWSLASHKGISHIVVMPHVTEEKISAFVEDYVASVERSDSPPLVPHKSELGGRHDRQNILLMDDEDLDRKASDPVTLAAALQSFKSGPILPAA